MTTQKITKIALTGGACAGKSTALKFIRWHFTSLGYTVVVISETATDFIAGGLSPNDIYSPYAFEKAIVQLQIAREAIYEETIKQINSDKILLVCDRGVPDARAYMPLQDWQRILLELDITEAELRSRYNAIFHLVTTAKGAPQFYGMDNNPHRFLEPLEVAVRQDDDIIDIYSDHPYLRIIDNSTGFNDKMQRLINAIAIFLGESPVKTSTPLS